MRICLLILLLFPALVWAAPAEPATAIFAGGCFWSMEAAFDDVPGVISAVSGYTGGTVANPSYEQVSKGDTGHVEAVKITYNPAKISYKELLAIFWHNEDPFNASGQFCDNGPEYRSEIFVNGQSQEQEAKASQQQVEKQLGKQTVTRILTVSAFYPAEEYHQHFKHKNPVQYSMYRTGCGRDARMQEIWGK